MSNYEQYRQNQMDQFKDSETFSKLSQLKYMYEQIPYKHWIFSSLFPIPVVIAINTLLLTKKENIKSFQQDVKCSHLLILGTALTYLMMLFHLFPFLNELLVFIHQPSTWQEFFKKIWREEALTMVIWYGFYTFIALWAMGEFALTNAFEKKYISLERACTSKWDEAVAAILNDQKLKDIQIELMRNAIGQAISQHLASVDFNEVELKSITEKAIQQFEHLAYLNSANPSPMVNQPILEQAPAYGHNPF